MTHAEPTAFGQADLSNCEREQIHLAGSIQPHGALLVLDDAGSRVLQASGNAAEWLGAEGAIVGRSLSSLPGGLADRLRPSLDQPLHRRPVLVRGGGAHPWNALLHRPPEGGIVVELERGTANARPPVDLEGIARTIVAADTLRDLAERTVTLVKDLTGYDRVMVYRFDELGHGEVFAERRGDTLEAFLGNRYPASDIPQMARRLYLQNRVRLLVDVDYAPVPLGPRLFPPTGRELDMSLCQLRSMSPIHLQYLKNMGVQATLVVSLVVGGTLWGLIACHHYSPRFVPFDTRALCELVAELVATRVVALAASAQTQAELAVRRLERTMAAALERDDGWDDVLFGSHALCEIVAASGAALIADGTIRTVGETPDASALSDLAAWLDEGRREPLSALAAIGREAPSLGALTPVAAGLMAVPVSALPGEYLVWFRPERKKTVVWGGDPTKPVVVGTDPRQLSPRLSFAQWHEVVEGTADPWTEADKITAKLLARAVGELRTRARSRQILLAQDRLETLSRQLRGAAQAVLLADAAGRVTLTTEAFADLLKAGHSPPHRIEDLTRLFEDSFSLVGRLDDLVRRDRPFEQEAALASFGDAPKMFVLRGTPLFADNGRRLGFVVELEATAERRTAEAARTRFEDALIGHARAPAGRLDLEGDRRFERACAAVTENARLAALELTYGVEAGGMTRTLEGMRASVARAAELVAFLAGDDAMP